MSQSLPLFRRIARNLHWYIEDVVTAVTGRVRPFHFSYGHDEVHEENPSTGQPMTGHGVDVTGRVYGSPLDRSLISAAHRTISP